MLVTYHCLLFKSVYECEMYRTMSLVPIRINYAAIRIRNECTHFVCLGVCVCVSHCKTWNSNSTKQISFQASHSNENFSH